jgi:hypothetical protein
MALPGLAQFREEEICKPQVGGFNSSRQLLGKNLITSATLKPQVKKEPRYCNVLGRGCESASRRPSPGYPMLILFNGVSCISERLGSILIKSVLLLTEWVISA